eukprot:SAG22_NODE_99_length_20560_cov_128.669029_2_plen_76_part_00
MIVKDLKPANVLIEHAAGGTLRLVIADFGISSLAGATTATGGMSGTPQFMAQSNSTGPRSARCPPKPTSGPWAGC